MRTAALGWAIVVPVKRLAAAKTRLSPDPAVRAELALAMAVDTVSAALRCGEVASVVVVTDEASAASTLRDLGARVVADEPDAGLNPALVHGVRDVATVSPGAAVAALSSDLPALRPDALGAVLGAAGGQRAAMVADAAGTGTTLLSAREVTAFAPSFGPGSRAAHVATGVVDLTELADARVRRDVDTVEDLAEAVALGVGPATTEAAVRLRLLG